jgi:quinol monooxygenase YgiN
MRSNFVGLHPYFKAHRGKFEQVTILLKRLVEKTATEHGCLFYEFSVKGDEFSGREGYASADALLAHLGNVYGLLAKAMRITDLIRLEVHGPAAELEKLKEPLGYLKPAFFTLLD